MNVYLLMSQKYGMYPVFKYFLQVVENFCKKINTNYTKIWTWKDDLQIRSAVKKGCNGIFICLPIYTPFWPLCTYEILINLISEIK